MQGVLLLRPDTLPILFESFPATVLVHSGHNLVNMICFGIIYMRPKTSRPLSQCQYFGNILKVSKDSN